MWGFWFLSGTLDFLLFSKPICRTALMKTIRHVHQADGLPASDLGFANHPSWSICLPPHHQEVSGQEEACIFTDSNQEPDWICLPWIAER